MKFADFPDISLFPKILFFESGRGGDPEASLVSSSNTYLDIYTNSIPPISVNSRVGFYNVLLYL